MIFLNPLSPSPLTPMNSALMGAFGWTTDQITLAQATLDSPQIDEENIDLDDGLVTYAYLDDVKSATIAAQESGTDIADFETTIQAIHDLKESLWKKLNGAAPSSDKTFGARVSQTFSESRDFLKELQANLKGKKAASFSLAEAREFFAKLAGAFQGQISSHEHLLNPIDLNFIFNWLKDPFSGDARATAYLAQNLLILQAGNKYFTKNPLLKLAADILIRVLDQIYLTESYLRGKPQISADRFSTYHKGYRIPDSHLAELDSKREKLLAHWPAKMALVNKDQKKLIEMVLKNPLAYDPGVLRYISTLLFKVGRSENKDYPIELFQAANGLIYSLEIVINTIEGFEAHVQGSQSRLLPPSLTKERENDFTPPIVSHDSGFNIRLKQGDWLDNPFVEITAHRAPEAQDLQVLLHALNTLEKNDAVKSIVIKIKFAAS